MELVFDTPRALAEAHRARFEAEAAKAIAARGRFVVALTGGSAASTVYPLLAGANVDWPRVHVFFGDERCVPAADPDSNLRAANEAWLSKTPGVVVHAVRTGLSPAAAADDYAQQLAPFLPFDVVHLGMGPDGHVCSLFPGHPLLTETSRTVASLTDSPKPPPARVTLTLPVLQAARACWFLVFGAAKAANVRSALRDPGSALPAAVVTRTAQQALWFLDSAAAAQL